MCRGTWSENPDVRRAGLNPLLHYLRHGELEGRRPISYFNPLWYCVAYEIPPNYLALRHFLTFRYNGRYAPCPELYSLSRLQASREQPDTTEDIFASAIDHALERGADAWPDEEIVTTSGLLDNNYYLINGTDVHEAELKPSSHFCKFGWREGRKPNIYFDSLWYIETNPNVSRLDINPLVHYIIEGEDAGRRPIVYFDPLWYRQKYGVRDRTNALAHYLSVSVAPPPHCASSG